MKAALLLLAVGFLAAALTGVLAWRMVAEGGIPSNASPLTGAGGTTGRP